MIHVLALCAYFYGDKIDETMDDSCDDNCHSDNTYKKCNRIESIDDLSVHGNSIT